MKVGTLFVRVSSVCVSSVNVVVLEVELVCIGDHLVMCWLGGEVTVGCGYGALESAGDGWVVQHASELPDVFDRFVKLV